MADLARAVGVSKSTVSRAFSHPDMLSPETVDRIAEVAARIGYSPNRAARALSTGRHRNIGVMVPDIANPFFPPLIRAGQIEADRSDFCVFLGNSDEDPAQEDRLVSHFLSQVSGLLLVASRLHEDRIRAYAALCPLVLVNRDVSDIPRILIDSGPAVAEAVRHLKALGHERIVYVSGPGEFLVGSRAAHGGLDCGGSVPGDAHRRAGREARLRDGTGPGTDGARKRRNSSHRLRRHHRPRADDRLSHRGYTHTRRLLARGMRRRAGRADQPADDDRHNVIGRSRPQCHRDAPGTDRTSRRPADAEDDSDQARPARNDRSCASAVAAFHPRGSALGIGFARKSSSSASFRDSSPSRRRPP